MADKIRSQKETSDARIGRTASAVAVCGYNGSGVRCLRHIQVRTKSTAGRKTCC
jgi:hypothetical protein